MKTCTICLEEGEDVKHFCKCNKETGLYHKECLKQWVKITWKIKCRFCETRYNNEIMFDLQWGLNIDDPGVTEVCFMLFYITIEADNNEFFKKNSIEIIRDILYIIYALIISASLVRKIKQLLNE